MIQRLRRSWESMSLYFPVMLMGLLALGSWWLVRNAPSVPKEVVAKTTSNLPDYTMAHFSVKDYDANGRMQSEVTGESAAHYPETDTLEIQRVMLRGYALDGTRTTATGNKGVSNADASEVQLWGNAVVVRDQHPSRPVMRFESEFLHAWTREERVKSHLPVVVMQGHDKFTGDSLAYDNINQAVQMQGRVRGVLQPGRP